MGDKNKDIPKGWVEADLIEIVDRLQYGHTAKASQEISEPKFLRITDIQDNNVNWSTVPGCKVSEVELERYTLEDGDLVFARSGSIEKAYRVSNPPLAIFASYLIRGKPFHRNLSYFLDYFIRSQSYLTQIGAHGSGIAIQNVNAKKLGSVKIPIPPLNEQKRIAAKIEELQARSRRAREALKTVPDLLAQLRQSILSAAFRGDLTRQWRQQNPDVEPATELLKRIRSERRKRWEAAELEKLKAKGLTGDKLDTQFAKRRKQYKEPEPVDTTDLSELPEKWCWASIDELSGNLQYGSSVKSLKSGKIPVIRMGNIQNGEIDWSNLAYSSDESEIEKYRLNPNTVLFNRTNSPDLVGKTAIYRGDHDAIFAGYLIRIQNLPHILPTYLNYVLNSPFIKRHCLMIKSDAVSQSNINATKLSKFPIPFCSEKEQAVIASHLETVLFEVENKVKWIKTTFDRLNEISQTILTKAFNGKLVPQDPNDEPASVLLERIRQEKACQAARQKTKPRQRGKKMKGQKIEQQDILTILLESARAMTPEELFAASGFGEDSVDEFYEQLRAAVMAKNIRETRKGAEVHLEAAS